MPGMHGTVAAVAAMQRSDLLVALGARFDDRVTGQLSTFAPDATIVHADIDPAEISKNRRADVPIVGDCAEVITELIAAVRAEHAPAAADLTAWWAQLDDCGRPSRWATTGRRTARCRRSTSSSGSAQIAGPDAIYTAGVGQHQMWAAQFIRYEKPGPGSTPVASARWATRCRPRWAPSWAVPDATVWAIDGDGCFQMTNQELATCAIENIPIKVAVINNGNLGMVRQWQNLFYSERYSQTDLGTHKHRIPDFKMLAEALGCVGLRCESKEDVDEVIERPWRSTTARW